MTRNVPYVLSDEEQQDFLAQFNKRYKTPHRNLVMCRCMLEAGLRSDEVRSLKIKDVDLGRRRLEIRDGKGGKDGIAFINESLVEEISEWLDRLSDLGCSSDWLFPTHNDTKVSGRYLRRMCKRTAHEADVRKPDEVSAHTLRHSFATSLLRDGANLRQVQEALRHENIQTTQVYTHIENPELEQIMADFQPKIGGA